MKTLLTPGSPTRRHLRRLLAGGIQTAQRVATGGRPRNEARILYYHRIDAEDHRSCVKPSAFRDQMQHLHDNGFRLVSLKTIASQLRDGKSFEPRTVAITFDDGFADNYERAYPILSALAIPATIFVTVGAVGSRLRSLRDRPHGVLALTWAQIREMILGPVDIGSHTMSHPLLSALRPEALERELIESRNIIAAETGIAPTTFCYPRGDFDARVRDAVRQAAYHLACATTPGGVTEASDPLALSRTFVARDDSLADFDRKLDGAFDYLHHGVALLRRRLPRVTAT